MRKSLNKDNENFSPDEYVDIINSKNNFSYEGKIMSIKGEKILVENIRNRKEELINKSDNRILKQWKRDRPIQKFNRVDFRLKDTDYWVEGIVMDIMPSPYNKLLIKYKNKNNYKPFAQELVDINDKRIAEIGLYTKDSNDKLLSSTFFNLEQSRFDNSDINIDNVKILNNKRNRPDTNNSLIDEEEERFKNLLLQNNLEIREVLGDGNCMFRAVSDQVYGTDEPYQILREKCMDYLVILKRYFEPYIDEDFDSYIKRKRKDKVWGDDVELEALSEIYNRPIEIYKESNKPLKTFHEMNYKQDSDYNYSLTPIRLSYHKNNHYNSIVPLESDKIEYRNYKNSLIKKRPGAYESKILEISRRNEVDFDKGIEISNQFTERLKQNLSNKLADISKINILNEYENENIKNKKKKVENEDENKLKNSTKNLNLSKNKVKDEIRDKNKYKEKNNENKNTETKNETNDIINDEEKDKETEKYNDKESFENQNKIQNIEQDYYLSNPTIKFAVESGFSIEDAIEAWSLYNDDKELVMDYLLNSKNNN